MSHTSQLNRYRPAIFTIAGAAAVYSIYVLYTTYSEQPARSGLHRSNAIHRPRGGNRSHFVIESSPPEADAPLGNLILRVGDRHSVVNLASAGIPSAGEVRQLLYRVPDSVDLQREIDIGGVQCVLQACFVARSSVDRLRLVGMGLEAVHEAVTNRDIGAVYRSAYTIRRALPSVSLEVVNIGIEKFRHSDTFISAEHPSSENDDTTFAETEDAEELDTREPSHGLKGLLYHIAEADVGRKAYEHRGIKCEECGEWPIRGIRWHCLNCPDFDLCSTCEANSDHHKTHVFVKIKVPLPVLSQPTKEYPLWYPGDPRKLHSTLPPTLNKRLGENYGFDVPQMEANYDQFTCIANAPWPDDPNGVKAAIDRRAFNKALTSERWPQRFRPNTIYDRMFAFYDIDSNGLIGIEEFVSGMSYLRGPNHFKPLTRALQGFDINGDGYVDRRDFIRLFRAKHEIQKLLINDMVEGHENEQTEASMETLRSSQPISSLFSLEEIPQGGYRPRKGKQIDPYGDMQPLPATKTVLCDREGWVQRPNRIWPITSNGDPRRSHEQPQHHISRFEELLSSPTDPAQNENMTEDQSEFAATINGTQPNGERAIRGGGVESNGYGAIDDDLNQDVLWEIVEDGFHEMLDPLFKSKEQEHQKIINTRKERQAWHKEIDKLLLEKRVFKEELESAAMVDPLMATANGSFSEVNANQQSEQSDAFRPQAVPRAAVVPTDWTSLSRLEAEIAERPLADLLNAIGYSAIDGDQDCPESISTVHESGHVDLDGESSRQQETSGPAPGELRPRSAGTQGPAYSLVFSTDLSRDPTMPQNRPNTSPNGHQASWSVKNKMPMAADLRRETADSQSSERSLEEEQPPSKERLEELAALDKQERGLKARGGLGRLSYEEIEAIVDADDTRELRGLITSWLEWASF